MIKRTDLVQVTFESREDLYEYLNNNPSTEKIFIYNFYNGNFDIYDIKFIGEIENEEDINIDVKEGETYYVREENSEYNFFPISDFSAQEMFIIEIKK